MPMLQREASIKEEEDVQEMPERIKESYRQVEVEDAITKREKAYEQGMDFDEDDEDDFDFGEV